MWARDFPLLYQVNLWHLQNDPYKCAKRLALFSNSSLHSQSYFTLCILQYGFRSMQKMLLHFEWSPPWHFKAYILQYFLPMIKKTTISQNGMVCYGFKAYPSGRSGSAHCDLAPAVEGPAVPTDMWSLRLRSSSAHWDSALAVESRV